MDIEALMPADTPGYMLPAWLGCIHWAIGEADVMRAFEAETGLRYSPAKTPLDRAIDQATGYSEDFLRQFIEWANVNVWGPMDGPLED